MRTVQPCAPRLVLVCFAICTSFKLYDSAAKAYDLRTSDEMIFQEPITDQGEYDHAFVGFDTIVPSYSGLKHEGRRSDSPE